MRRSVTLLVFVVPSLLPSPASAQVCDIAFTGYQGASTGAWQFGLNWDLGRKPFSTEVACINAGKTAGIAIGMCIGGANNGASCATSDQCPPDDMSSGVCEPQSTDISVAAIRLLGPVGTYNVRVETGSLTLNGHATQDSELIGKLYFNGSTVLTIASDLTILGDGGVLEGEFQYPAASPRIVGPGTLTIRGSAPGQREFTCHGGPDDGALCYPDDVCAPGGTCTAGHFCDPPNPGGRQNDCDCRSPGICRGSIMITEAWDIQAPLVNDASVIATHNKGIFLNGPGKKSGTGIWRANDRDEQGLLVVNCEIEMPPQVDWAIGGSNDATNWRAEPGGTIRIESEAIVTFLQNPSGRLHVFGSENPMVELKKPDFLVPGGIALESGILSVGVEFTSDVDLDICGGHLQILQPFDTLGNLVWDGGFITVEAGAWAFFD
jgi:hypothetical protein